MGKQILALIQVVNVSYIQRAPRRADVSQFYYFPSFTGDLVLGFKPTMMSCMEWIARGTSLAIMTSTMGKYNLYKNRM